MQASARSVPSRSCFVWQPRSAGVQTPVLLRAGEAEGGKRMRRILWGGRTRLLVGHMDDRGERDGGGFWAIYIHIHIYIDTYTYRI